MAFRFAREPSAPNARADNHELARLAAAGNTDATSRLLERVAPEMMRVVRGVMGPFSSDVDDVLQQSLIGFIQALPAFRGECEPAGYACRIALRTAFATRKIARVRLSRYGRRVDLELEREPTTESPAEESEARRRTELLRSLLDQLPEEQAEALAMRCVLGWSLEEIAASNGCPVNTVRSRLRLAKEAMRRKIESDPRLADELGAPL